MDADIVSRLSDLLSQEKYSEVINESKTILADTGHDSETIEFVMFNLVHCNLLLKDMGAARSAGEAYLEKFPSGIYVDGVKGMLAAITTMKQADVIQGAYELFEAGKYQEVLDEIAIIGSDPDFPKEQLEVMKRLKVQTLKAMDQVFDAQDALKALEKEHPDAEVTDLKDSLRPPEPEPGPVPLEKLGGPTDIIDDPFAYGRIHIQKVTSDQESQFDDELRQYHDGLRSNNWRTGQTSVAKINLELFPAGEPTILGILNPLHDKDDRHEEVIVHIDATIDGNRVEAGSYSIDTEAKGIQLFPMDIKGSPTKIQLQLEDRTGTAGYFKLDSIYLFCEPEDHTLIDEENLKSTIIPRFNPFERKIPTGPLPARHTVMNLPAYHDHFHMVDGKAICIDMEGGVVMYEAGKMIKETKVDTQEVVTTWAHRSTNRLLIQGKTEDGLSLYILDLKTLALKDTVELPGERSGDRTNLVFSDNFTLLLYGTYQDNRAAAAIEMRDADLKKTLWKKVDFISASYYYGMAGTIGKYVAAVGTTDGRILILNMNDGSVYHEFPNMGKSVDGLSLVNDDSLLIATAGRNIRLLSTKTGQQLYSAGTQIERMRFEQVSHRLFLVRSDSGTFLADLKAGESKRLIATDKQPVDVDEGDVHVLVDQHVCKIVDAVEQKGSTFYLPGDELWVLSDGEFELQLGSFKMACSDSFLLDAHTYMNVHYLKGYPGEVKVTSQEEYTLYSTRTELDPSLLVPDAEEKVLDLKTNPDTCLSKKQLAEFDYDFEEARIVEWYSSGTTKKKLNIVFFGDGFTEEDLQEGGAFDQQIEIVVKKMRSTFPFNLFIEDINFTVVYMPSIDRGADDDPRTDNRNTAFNAAYYGIPGVPTALIVQNTEAIVNVLERVEAYDLVGIIVNDTRIGGTGTTDSGGFIFTSSVGEDLGDIVMHEIGHTFGKLADEYESEAMVEQYKFPVPPPKLSHPNVQTAKTVDLEDLERTLKWRDFHNDLRTKEHAGAELGGHYMSEGVYRPHKWCKMRNSPNEFCVVCAYELYRRLCKRTGRVMDRDEFIVQWDKQKK